MDLKFLAAGQWPKGIRLEREAQNRPCLTIGRLPRFTGGNSPFAARRLHFCEERLTVEQMLVSAGMNEGKNAMESRERHGGGSAVRRVWILVGAFVLVRIAYYVYFEWTNLVHLYEDEDHLLFGTMLLGIVLANIILFINAVLRRRIKPALIYAAFFVLHLESGRWVGEIDMTAKAYFFSAYPSMCPEGSPKPGYRAFICYKYWFSHAREALVFNPGDEMAQSSKHWPLDIKEIVLERGQTDIPISDVEECFVRKTKHVTNHMYLVSDDCFGKSE
jgi:hypothetical protein